MCGEDSGQTLSPHPQKAQQLKRQLLFAVRCKHLSKPSKSDRYPVTGPLQNFPPCDGRKSAIEIA
jgi:hypothetical protein